MDQRLPKKGYLGFDPNPSKVFAKMVGIRGGERAGDTRDAQFVAATWSLDSKPLGLCFLRGPPQSGGFPLGFPLTNRQQRGKPQQKDRPQLQLSRLCPSLAGAGPGVEPGRGGAEAVAAGQNRVPADRRGHAGAVGVRVDGPKRADGRSHLPLRASEHPLGGRLAEKIGEALVVERSLGLCQLPASQSGFYTTRVDLLVANRAHGTFPDRLTTDLRSF